MDWLEEINKVMCDNCKTNIKPIIRKRVIEDAVSNLVGELDDYVPLQPREIFNLLCNDDKRNLKKIMEEIVSQQARIV